MRSLIVLGVLAAAPRAEAVPCRPPNPTARPARAKVVAPSDGGVVVMQSFAHDDQPGSSGTVTQEGWRFRVKGKDVVPRIEVLAPGLAVYRVPGRATAAELTDGKSQVLTRLQLGTEKGPAFAAPRVTAITQTMKAYPRGALVMTRVQLAADPPAGVVAVVIADDKGPRTWGAVTAKDREPVVYVSGACGGHADGTRASAVGDKLKVMFVDEAGRVSAPATATVIDTPAP